MLMNNKSLKLFKDLFINFSTEKVNFFYETIIKLNFINGCGEIGRRARFRS